MARHFEELDWRPTPMGPLSLRRRREPRMGVEIYEIMLGRNFLMSSLFTDAEIALSRLGLAELPDRELDVVIGGLGLGYSAQAALAEPRLRSLIVIDALPAVIEWHEKGLLPLGPALAGDQRCRLVHGDFFRLAAADSGFDPDAPGRRFHAILVDIDHTPRKTLDPGHASFYTVEQLQRLAEHLHPGGVFALWSDDPPEAEFEAVLTEAFDSSRAEIVSFPNPLRGGEASNTIYLARKAKAPVKRGEALPCRSR